MKTNLVAAILIISVIVIASVYGAYNVLNFSAAPSSSPAPTSSPASTPQQTSTPSASTPTPSPSASSSVTSSQNPPQPNLPMDTQAPREITIVDKNGAYVTVNLPVKRIVCLTMIEIVYVLGAGDRIVGYDAKLSSDTAAVLPSSLLANLRDVGTDMAPNLELIIELQPDLLLASQRLSDENRRTLENAGIAVIEDTLMWPRRNDCIRNLGLILQAEAKAEELIAYEQHYVDLVTARTAGLTRSAKPSVYFEWYKQWFSTGPGGSYSDMIIAAGGINIGENATVSSPQLSPEFVAEANPAVIIRMLTYLDGEDLAAYQNLRNDMLTRTALSGTTAVKEGRVYIIKSALLVERQMIGLLYFAKWLHPSLFQDIDPTTVHTEYIRRFFSADLTGVFVYP
ncbi:MAG: ABC transporter substrate-binding protein [Candidatus Bathyarchaeia archaeon]